MKPGDKVQYHSPTSGKPIYGMVVSQGADSITVHWDNGIGEVTNRVTDRSYAFITLVETWGVWVNNNGMEEWVKSNLWLEAHRDSALTIGSVFEGNFAEATKYMGIMIQEGVRQGWKGVTYSVKSRSQPVAPKSRECPCGIYRQDCTYHA